MEGLIEGILLPVVSIIGEFDSSLNIYTYCQLDSGFSVAFLPTQIDVLQESEVERCANSVVLVLREYNVTTIVAAFDGL